MLILGLLGMYFDAAVVFVTNSSILFRLAVAILCSTYLSRHKHHKGEVNRVSLNQDLNFKLGI